MKNLLGRLNARSSEDVARIATTWRIGVDGADKLGMVANVYRALTDVRTIRDVWAALPDDECALIVALLETPNGTLTIPELATGLQLPAEEIRRRATALFQKGLVVREGDDAALKVGELPRLFLPRELAVLIRRVRAEIAAGDVSGAPLPALLASLDDVEIEQAADAWGLHVIAGLKSRAELTRLLLSQIDDPLRRETVTAKLTGAPAKIWRAVRAGPSGRPLALSEALAAAELNERDPRAAHRGRLALADLEDKLLLWHTYNQHGERLVFIPAEIIEAGQRPAVQTPPPATVTVETKPASAASARHPHALAWDLLSLLRAISEPGAPKMVDLEEAPHSWLRNLNRALWNRGPDEPPEGYLAFLLDLAAIERLVEGGDAGAEQPYALTAEMRAWRTQSFAEQSSRLRSAWLRAAVWIEGDEQGDIEVWGADWPGFRLKLLAHLSAFADQTWRALADASGWLANRDPEMLGSQFRAATARATEISGDERASRSAAIAEVIGVTLSTAADWFGLIDVMSLPRQPRSMRLTRLGVALAAGNAAPPDETGGAPALDVTATGEIVLRGASPLRVWSLSAFAELIELNAESRYRLTEASVRRALAAGFEKRQIMTYLRNETGARLPAAVEALLETWSKKPRRVRVGRTVAITPDNAGELGDLIGLFERDGQRVRLFETVVLIDVADQAGEERVRALLRANGYLQLESASVERPGEGQTGP